MRVQILSALRQGAPSRLKVGDTAGSKACATGGHQSRLPPIYPPTLASSSLVAALTILNCSACSEEWAPTACRETQRRLSVCRTADFQSAPAWSLMRVQILSALRQGAPSRLKVGDTAGSKACATGGHQSRLPPIYPTTLASSSLVAALTILNCSACSEEWAPTACRETQRRLSGCRTADFQSAPAWSLMRVQILSALRQGTPSRLKVGGTAGSKACATDGHQSRLPPIYPPTPAGSSLVATLTILNCLACSAEWARTVSSRNVAQTFRLPYRRLSVCSGMEPDARANSQRPPAGHAQPTESRRYSRRERLRYGLATNRVSHRLPSHAGRFFVGRNIDDLKLLGVQRGVGADRLSAERSADFQS